MTIGLQQRVPDAYSTKGRLRRERARRCGLAVRRQAGKQRDLGSIRFGPPLSSKKKKKRKKSGLRTLSCDFAQTIYETSKCLTQLSALMQSHSSGDSVTSR